MEEGIPYLVKFLHKLSKIDADKNAILDKQISQDKYFFVDAMSICYERALIIFV